MVGDREYITFTFSIVFPSSIVYANAISTFNTDTDNPNDVIEGFSNNYIKYNDHGDQMGAKRTFFLMVLGF